MKTPAFWYKKQRGFMAQMLRPLSWLYRLGYCIDQAIKRAKALEPVKARVICIGNATAGGAGKTPVTMALYQEYAAMGRRVAIVSRGYGGQTQGPLKVDVNSHDAQIVGDEPFMMARAGCTVWVGKNRKDTLKAAAAEADILLMDDGFQNPMISKDHHVLVVDGRFGFGNGLHLPAGPLRQSVAEAADRANLIVMIDEDHCGIKQNLVKQARVVKANVKLDLSAVDLTKPVSAFAGIAIPEKFFKALEENGVILQQRLSFPDHHAYSETEIAALTAATEYGQVLTTVKDMMRLPKSLQSCVQAIPMMLDFETSLVDLLDAETVHG